MKDEPITRQDLMDAAQLIARALKDVAEEIECCRDPLKELADLARRF